MNGSLFIKAVYNSGGKSLLNMGRVSLKYGLATHEEMALQLCLTDGVQGIV